MTAVVDLFEHGVQILTDGSVDPSPADPSTSAGQDDGVIQVEPPPGVGATFGGARLSESSRHAGERHPDGDELVYLVRGQASVSLETDDAGPEVYELRPGEVLVVPRGRWHRLLIDAPSELLFLTPGRTEVRRRPGD